MIEIHAENVWLRAQSLAMKLPTLLLNIETSIVGRSLLHGEDGTLLNRHPESSTVSRSTRSEKIRSGSNIRRNKAFLRRRLGYIDANPEPSRNRADSF